jgi:hypothetical protein
MRPSLTNRYAVRRLAIAAALLAIVVAPATAHAAAEQVVIQIVDEVVATEFDDPCTGVAVHGDAVESGILRVTDLGDRGYHLRIDVRGEVDLYDAADTYVGTWSYRLTFRDQFPPDAQGAVQNVAVGPLVYADGSTALVQGHTHEVFGKGDLVRREFFKTICARG